MYYLNFTIDDNVTLTTFLNSSDLRIVLYFKMDGKNIKQLPNYFYPRVFKLHDFNIDTHNLFDKEGYRHSAGYFEFKTDTIDINDIEKSIDNAIIKYVIDDNQYKHNCECKLSNFISNKQLIRDVKIDKILL